MSIHFLNLFKFLGFVTLTKRPMVMSMEVSAGYSISPDIWISASQFATLLPVLVLSTTEQGCNQGLASPHCLESRYPSDRRKLQ